jgi:transcriptional regulator GlxA family with amidase domain
MTRYLQKNRKICFLLLPNVHLLDLSGPAQVFYEASNFGPQVYDIIFAGVRKQIHSEQGLLFSDLARMQDIVLNPGDFIFVPGVDLKTFYEGKLRKEINEVKPWLSYHYSNGVCIGSICSGALILAEAGLLDGKKCTSHWKCIDYIKKHYSRIIVQTDQLFVKDRNIYTSAGMSSGIDMSLSILEDHHGPLLSAKVAREMVVYLRRNNTDRQETIYLDYKTHFNPSIHKVQDHIISHPSKNFTLEELAGVGNTSVRTLTRLFKTTTGHTILDFKNTIKLELALTLINNPEYTVEKIAGLCGFVNARHLRRVWKKKLGKSPGAFREKRITRNA